MKLISENTQRNLNRLKKTPILLEVYRRNCDGAICIEENRPFQSWLISPSSKAQENQHKLKD
jgi:hypothetical protein